MIKKKIKAFLLPALLLLLLVIASILLANSLINRPSVQQYLLDQLAESTGFELSTGKIDISLWGGIGITAHDLEAKSRFEPESITASRVRIFLDARELIKGRIVPTRMSMLRPRIKIALEQDWIFSKPGETSGLKKMILRRLSGLSAVSMKQAKVYIENLPFELEDIIFSASQKKKDPTSFDVRLEGKVAYKGEKAPFKLRGNISRDAEAKNDPFADVLVKANDIPLTWIPWPVYLPVDKGQADIDIRVAGKLDGPLSAAGKITMDDLHLRLVRPHGSKSFLFPKLAFDFESRFSERVLEISAGRLDGPDFSLSVSTKIDFEDRSNPGLTLRLKSPYVPLKEFKAAFPTPLLPQWIENRLFAVLTDKYGEISVNHFFLEGPLNRIGKLNRPENAECLSMKLSWKNLEVLENGSGLPFNNVSGELTISNGILHVSEVKGSFGSSTVKKGTLDIDTLYDDTFVYDISIDGLFRLEDLLRQRDMDLIPINVSRHLYKFVDAAGNLEAQIRFHFERGWDYPKIQKGALIFKNCTFTQKQLLLPLVLGEVEIQIDDDGKSRFYGTGLWGNSRFNTKGSVDNQAEAGMMSMVARIDANEILNHFYQGNQLPVKFTNPVPCRISLSKQKDIWSCNGEIDPKEVFLDIGSFTVNPQGQKDKIVFSVDFQPLNKVFFKKISCLFGSSAIEFSGSYDLMNQDLFDFKVTTPGLLMGDLGLQSKKNNEYAEGIIVCDADVKGSRRKPLLTSVTGRVVGRDLSFISERLPSPIRDANFRLDLSDKNVSISFLKMKVGESPIHVKGKLMGWDGLEGKLEVESTYMNISDFKSKRFRSLFEKRKSDISRFASHTIINLDLNIERGLWRTLEYGPLRADCAYRSGDMRIRQLKAYTAYGSLKVNGLLKSGKQPEISLSSHIVMTEQPVKELLQTFGIRENYLEGRLTTEAVLFAKGRDKKELISSLTGCANLLIEQGKINKSHVIFTILDFLSLQKILMIFKERPPDLSEEGFYFESIKGDITIDKGMLDTENLIMKSPVFNAAAKGSIDLTRKWLDFDLGAQPLGTIDFLISNIPIVGYILTGKDESILVYYFKVKGAWPKTEVEYVPLKNLGSGVAGFFKRLLFLDRPQ
jgi:hypothetical protein